MDAKLSELYYSPENPAIYGGVERLYIEARKENLKVTKKQVQKWLESKKKTYTLHAPARKKFRRRRIFTKGIFDLVETDLIDVSNHSRSNRGIHFLCVFIDTFSKRAYVYPMKKKTAQITLDVMKQFLADIAPEKVVNMRSDRGLEYTNNLVTTYLDEQGVNYYHSKDDKIKCAIVERFNRTIKSRIYRYLTKNNTKRYIDELDNIVRSYNHSKHRSIKCRPVDITHDNKNEIFKILFPPKYVDPKDSKYKFGDHVRIAVPRNPFAKGYKQTFSDEIYLVSKVIDATPYVYKLNSEDGEEILRSWYAEELQMQSSREE